ncbi:teicoplanin resistance protein VanZ [Paenibacillus sp. J31TS4]|uniref:VanZ family protein n=1 Tax=Paenibacillus sp. J31TS4 TaxID=2807195 RepID=UPI001B13F8C5|nr:VanZ family protein [Paenibacillus sp. J31TS4]GIP39767.1 teicoplanin resistance protein VanZ [Paenibacillus sp. J31TS4]
MRLVYRWLPAVVWMAVIFTFSAQTGSEINTLLPFFQKLLPAMQSFDWGHFLEYFVLGLAFLWALADEKPTWKAKLGVIVPALLYGATDEYHQLFVPGRMSDLADLRNDGIGAALAMLFVSIPGIARLYAKLPHAKKR